MARKYVRIVRLAFLVLVGAFLSPLLFAFGTYSQRGEYQLQVFWLAIVGALGGAALEMFIRAVRRAR